MEISMLKKIKIGLSGAGCFFCATAYITGMTPYGKVSDILMISALACIILGDIVFMALPPKENEIRNKKQLFMVQLLFAVLAVSYLSYHKTDVLKQPVSLLAAALSVVWLLCGVIGLFRLRAGSSPNKKENRKENLAIAALCGVFLLFSWSEIISISQWDSTFYINSLNQFVEEYDLTFKTLLSGSMGGHLSTGYSLLAGAFHMLCPQGNIGIKILNILLGWGAIFCFFRILQKAGIDRGFSLLGTLMFAVSPMFLGIIGVISVDYAMLVYFLFFLYSWQYETSVFMVVSGFLFLFTKETAIILYVFFWAGVFLYRAFTLEGTEKAGLRKLLGLLSKREWEAVCIPAALFLVTFGIYAGENIGWPGIVTGGKLPVKYLLALFLLAVFLLAAVKVWIDVWFWVKRRGLSRRTDLICRTGVLSLPLLAGMAGAALLWKVKPWVVKKLLIHGSKDINRIGIGKDHIEAILKQAYILHFSWILLIAAAAGAIFFIRGWKNYTKRERELITAVAFSDIGLVSFTMFYVTYQNPRYLQLHYAFLILLALLFWHPILAGKARRQRLIGNGAAAVLAGLLLCETYMYADPFTRLAFYNRDIGNGVLCAGSNGKVSGVSSSYSDRSVNNRVYAYYLKNFEKFLKDIEYDGSQILLFPEKNDWVVLGRKNIGTMDTELKCIISYEGSIADSVFHLQSEEEMEAYRNGEREVYYVDTGALHCKMDQWMEEHYSGQVYQTFTTGSWKTKIYRL